MLMTRRAFTAALSLTGLAALAGFSPLRLFGRAMAQGATDVAKTDVAKPVSLPDNDPRRAIAVAFGFPVAGA